MLLVSFFYLWIAWKLFVNILFYRYLSKNKKQKTDATAVAILPKPSGNPCLNNPCGPFSECRAIGESPACSCLPNYVGRPPNCRPECIHSAECPANLACINERCSDPCVGACGIHTFCSVINHNSICQCEHGFTGDPFSGCTDIPKCKTSFLSYSLFFSCLIHLFIFILQAFYSFLYSIFIFGMEFSIISSHEICFHQHLCHHLWIEIFIIM